MAEAGTAVQASPSMHTEFPIDRKATKTVEDEQAYEAFVEVWQQQLEQNWQGGYTQVPDEIWHDSTLSPRAKIVYKALLSFMWFKTDKCWPSQETLAAATGYSVRTVIRALKDLYERGYIEKWRRGQGDTNYYFLNPLSFAHSFKAAGRGRGVLLQAKAAERLVDISSTPHVVSRLCHVVTSENDNVADLELTDCQTNQTNQKKIQQNSMPSNHSIPPSGEGVGRTAIRKATDEPASSALTKTEGTNQFPTQTTQSNTNQNEDSSKKLAGPARAKEALMKKQGTPASRAAAIALATGIPEEHLAEMGVAQERPRRPIPDFIQWYMADYSRDLGDNPRSLKSSVTRATKLYYWACDCIPGEMYLGDKPIGSFQDDPEGVFTALLYAAKVGALNVTKVKYQTGQKPNRMPAFFACLENLFGGLSPEELAYVRSDAPFYRPEGS